jgi:hypothetical protein
MALESSRGCIVGYFLSFLSCLVWLFPKEMLGWINRWRNSFRCILLSLLSLIVRSMWSVPVWWWYRRLLCVEFRSKPVRGRLTDTCILLGQDLASGGIGGFGVLYTCYINQQLTFDQPANFRPRIHQHTTHQPHSHHIITVSKS